MKIEPVSSDLSELFIRGFYPINEAERIKLAEKLQAAYCSFLESDSSSEPVRTSSYEHVLEFNWKVFQLQDDSTNCLFLYNLLTSRDPVFPVFIKHFGSDSLVVAGTRSSFGSGLLWTAFSINSHGLTIVNPAGDKKITPFVSTYSLIEVLKDIE